MNIQKVTVLFRGMLRDLLPDQTTSTAPEQPCYFLSPCNAALGSPLPHYEYTFVEDFETLSRRSDPRMTLNAFLWAKEDPQLLETALFSPGFPATEALFLLRRASERFLQRCDELGVHTQHLHYKSPGLQVPLRVIALRFTNGSQFSALFWPDFINCLYDTLLLTFLQSPLLSRPEIRLQQNVELFSGMPRSGNIHDYFVAPEQNFGEWRCTIKSNFSYFDSGNPIYCIDSRFQTAFETALQTAFETRGYEFHILPLRKTLIWNWQYFGEIPLLS